MDAYCAEIYKLEGHFEGIEFQHVPRNNNIAADVLSKLGSRQALVRAGVFVQDLRKPSISSWILIIQSHLRTTKIQHLSMTCS
jgi:hypothetical protein